MAISGLAQLTGLPEDELRTQRASRVPIKRMGTGWDTAYAALFLASEEAAFITGVILPVDGGSSVQFG
jgi:NAD(P)-dependent dehydrogenase (short-subunit alcohol dehydrogenase family)